MHHLLALQLQRLGVAHHQAQPRQIGQQLLHRATDAMHQAKLEGRNRCVMAG